MERPEPIDELEELQDPKPVGTFAILSCGMVVLVGALFAAGFLVLSTISDSASELGFKPPVAMLGPNFANEEVHESYQVLRNAIGFGFPEGTLVDVYDTGFDRLTGCFLLPSTDVEWFVSTYLELKPVDSGFPMPEVKELSGENASLPSTAVPAMSKMPTDYAHPIRMMYDAESLRLWVVCQYPGWFD